MKKIVKRIGYYLLSIILFFSNIFTYGCANIKPKQEPPEVYFSGTQLQLAKAIVDHNLSKVQALAPSTNLNKPGSQEMTLLMYALLEAAIRGDEKSLEIVTELVKAGADPLQDIPDMGSPAAMMVCSGNHIYMKALVEGGLDPNAMDNYQPLIFNSVSEKSFSVLKYLLSVGADIDKTDSAGHTVLMLALLDMELDVVEYLLNDGADPNIVTPTGMSFGSILQSEMKRESNSNKRTMDKLEEIQKLAIKKGKAIPSKGD